MQTLNVGSGLTDVEYRAAEEHRRAALLEDSRSDANHFFWAAGLAALGTGLLPVRLNVFVGVGAVDMLTAYGRGLGPFYPIAVFSAAAAWFVAVAALGFAARRGHRWAFRAGIALYGADMILLIVMFSLGAFGIHAFFLLKWFEGQKAIREASTSTA